MNIWISELSDPYRQSCKVQQADTIVNNLDIRAIRSTVVIIGRLEPSAQFQPLIPIWSVELSLYKTRRKDKLQSALLIILQEEERAILAQR